MLFQMIYLNKHASKCVFKILWIQFFCLLNPVYLYLLLVIIKIKGGIPWNTVWKIKLD